MKLLPRLVLCALPVFLSGCVTSPSGIHEAAMSGDIERIDSYLKDRVGVNLRQYGQSPLYIAALSDQPEAAEFLISKGARIEQRSTWHDGQRPLQVAAGHGHYRMVELLLNKGAKVDGRDWNGTTPLMEAAECLYDAPTGAYAKIAELLIAKGADVNAGDDDRQTPLHRAPPRIRKSDCEYQFKSLVFTNDRPQPRHPEDYEQIVKTLITHGADANARDSKVRNRGKTPLVAAMLSMNKGAVEALLKAGADPNAVIERLDQLRAPEPKDHLMPYDAKFATNRITTLGWAKRIGETEIVDLLVKYGARE